jgi:hypothetical protein
MTNLNLALTNCYYNLLKIKSINERYISSLPIDEQSKARDKFVNNLSNNYNNILNNDHRSKFDKNIAKYALDQIKYWN